MKDSHHLIQLLRGTLRHLTTLFINHILMSLVYDQYLLTNELWAEVATLIPPNPERPPAHPGK